MNNGITRQITAIPNLYGYLRILLIPEFIWLYTTGNKSASLAILLLSGISDLLDGQAARNLGQVTPLGKVLDPVADKLTQLAVLLCLVADFKPALYIVIILAAKEGGAAICGAALLVSGGSPFSSKWYGKVSTFSLYTYFGVLLAFNPPDGTVLFMSGAAGLILLVTFILYTFEFLRKISGFVKIPRRL